MNKTPNGTARARRAYSIHILLAFILLIVAPIAPASAAQSGRRKTDPARQSPVPPPASAEPQGESESQPRRAEKNQSVSASFVIYEDENALLDFSIMSQRDIVGATFFDRLRRSPAVEVVRAGRGSRKDARDRARKESTAHVVLLQLEEDMTARTGQSGRTDPGTLSLRLYVYAPTSGDLKFTEYISQRPYRSGTSVGGVRLPVPVSRERYPGEYQLAQAARDAADRLLSRFDIARPPDN